MKNFVTYVPGIAILVASLSMLIVVLLAKNGIIHIDWLEPISSEDAITVRKNCESLEPADGLTFVRKDYLSEWDRAGVFVEFESPKDSSELATQLIAKIDRSAWKEEVVKKDLMVKHNFYQGKFYIIVSYSQLSFLDPNTVWLSCGWHNVHY